MYVEGTERKQKKENRSTDQSRSMHRIVESFRTLKAGSSWYLGTEHAQERFWTTEAPCKFNDVDANASEDPPRPVKSISTSCNSAAITTTVCKILYCVRQAAAWNLVGTQWAAPNYRQAPLTRVFNLQSR